ncbi:hypothetical protein H4R33_004155 [Dimargaris cristalligena]|nr:hypothetical protein H4R33_004155 [Dimargaris cristalligena]
MADSPAPAAKRKPSTSAAHLRKKVRSLEGFRALQENFGTTTPPTVPLPADPPSSGIQSQPVAPISNSDQTNAGDKDKSQSESKKSKESKRYIYGNYAQYYGYRQPSQGTVDPVAALDPRIALLDPAWIRNQRVLDIGCNAGFVTSGLALHLQPWWAVGVDIDPTLIRKAKQHLHFINSLLPPSFHSTSIENISTRPAIYFPLSMPRLFGNIPVFHHPQVPAEYYTRQNVSAVHNHSGDRKTEEKEPSHSAQLTPTPTLVQSPLKFPQNVFYHSLNWLHPPDPSPLPTHYDTILALSVSKWIHLHHGDFGLCQFFQKAYDQLVPGGRFVLEPQAFEGYAKRSRLTETMSHNYQSIQMRPEHFKEHLMSVVGFTSVMVLRDSADSSTVATVAATAVSPTTTAVTAVTTTVAPTVTATIAPTAAAATAMTTAVTSTTMSPAVATMAAAAVTTTSVTPSVAMAAAAVTATAMSPAASAITAMAPGVSAVAITVPITAAVEGITAATTTVTTAAMAAATMSVTTTSVAPSVTAMSVSAAAVAPSVTTMPVTATNVAPSVTTMSVTTTTMPVAATTVSPAIAAVTATAVAPSVTAVSVTATAVAPSIAISASGKRAGSGGGHRVDRHDAGEQSSHYSIDLHREDNWFRLRAAVEWVNCRRKVAG